MNTITTDELVTVTGGTRTNDAVTQQLTTLQSSIKDLAANQNKDSGFNATTAMMMAMAFRPQAQTVVAAPAAPAAGPIVNINTRVRRW